MARDYWGATRLNSQEDSLDDKQAMADFIKHFGSRIGFLGYQLTMLSVSGQPCDLTFFKSKPILDVKIDPKITLALMYGAGPEKLKEMLQAIKLSNGTVVSISDIWTINPMPVKGFTKEELAAVDLTEAEEAMGPKGETLREMIRQSYHCTTKEEEDKYLRRFIAS